MEHVDDTPLSKRELKMATKLFGLAALAMFDTAETEIDSEEWMVLSLCSETATQELFKSFPALERIPNTLQGCIDAIKGMRK